MALTSHDIDILADFECANAEEIRRLDDGSFVLRTRPDQAVDDEAHANVGYFAAFRIVNRGDQAEARVCIEEPGPIKVGRTVVARPAGSAGWDAVQRWSPVPAEQVQALPEQNATVVRQLVPARGAIDVATACWMSATEVAADLECLLTRFATDMRLDCLGRSVQGRPIPVVDLSARAPSNAPRFLLSATNQPHELGTILALALLRDLLDGELREWSTRWRVTILPLTNPDGNALGTCMTNSRRQNVYFGYGQAGCGGAAVECDAVWRFVKALRPDAFLEMHSYPHLNKPSFRPYEFDEALYPDDASRHRGRRLSEALRETTPHSPVRVKAESAMDVAFRSTLPSKLIRELGVPGTLYKFHSRETIEANHAQARRVVGAVLRAMSP